ncbi:MAG: MGMT family protein [Nanoarchaeota archaeon]|mgnify:CR=1 FL=1
MNFNEKVYKLCKKIPKGKISTYKEIANALNTKAYRAVGNALNKNPYAPEIPCHRVIGSNGDLVGFASGLKNKSKLLKKEGINIKNNKVLDFEKVFYKF